jgi:hypothetical protein
MVFVSMSLEHICPKILAAFAMYTLIPVLIIMDNDDYNTLLDSASINPLAKTSRPVLSGTRALSLIWD